MEGVLDSAMRFQFKSDGLYIHRNFERVFPNFLKLLLLKWAGSEMSMIYFVHDFTFSGLKNN